MAEKLQAVKTLVSPLSMHLHIVSEAGSVNSDSFCKKQLHAHTSRKLTYRDIFILPRIITYSHYINTFTAVPGQTFQSYVNKPDPPTHQ